MKEVFSEEEAKEIIDRYFACNPYPASVLEVVETLPMLNFQPHLSAPKSKLNRTARYVGIRSTPKINRNSPCPCGSGKKYKNCCTNEPKSEKVPEPPISEGE
jgi:uncharacterized protein YecA (UPF0149 family)